ncbi:MAG: MFS transporter [Anaerolineales bacterium]
MKTKLQHWLRDFFTLTPEDTPNPKIKKHFRRNFFVNIGDIISWNFGDSFVSADTILPVFVSTLTSSPVLIGMVRALWQAGWYLPQLFLAPLVEKRKRQLPLVLVLALLERLPYLIIGLAVLWFPKIGADTTVIVFLLLYSWKSIASGFTALPWQEMIAKVIPVTRRGRLIGIGYFIGRLVGVFGGILAGIVLDRIVYPSNYAALFFISFVFVMVSWVFLSSNKEPVTQVQAPPQEGRPPPFKRMVKILREHKNFRNYLISRVFAYIGSMAYGFVAVYVIQIYGLPDTYAAVFTTVLFASGTIGFIFWGNLGDRIGHKRVIISSTLVWVAGIALLILMPSFTWVYFVFVLMSISSTGGMVGDFNIAMEFGSEPERPTYIGLSKTLTAPVVLAVPLLAGLIVNAWGYPAMFVVSLAFSVLAVIVLGINVKDPRHPAVGDTRIR